MISFRKWIEDTGQVWPATNDEPYALAGVQSRIVSNDARKTKPEHLATKIFGKKKKIKMKTFKEYMDSAKSLFGDNKDTRAKAVIRAGINLRPDFWDDFISITNDAEGVSELLDIPKEKVANWSSLIKDVLEDVESTDSEEKGGRSEILGTGEDIENPNGHPDHIDDLRPTP